MSRATTGSPSQATTDFINTLPPKELIELMSDAKAEQYRAIAKEDPTQQQFLAGWLKRSETRRTQARRRAGGGRRRRAAEPVGTFPARAAPGGAGRDRRRTCAPRTRLQSAIAAIDRREAAGFAHEEKRFDAPAARRTAPGAGRAADRTARLRADAQRPFDDIARPAARRASAPGARVWHTMRRPNASELAPHGSEDRPPETIAAQALGWVEERTRAVAPPVHASSTFLRDPDNQYRSGRVYARADNPAFDQPEAVLCALEGGAHAALFASGMAAATAVFQALAPATTSSRPR